MYRRCLTRVTAVSYTHLDVYKRQGYGMAQERDVMYTNVIPLGTDVLALHLDLSLIHI